jgi:hypothetical protein
MGKYARTAHCRLTAFGEAVLTFPYRAALVDELKSAIPFRFRSYDPKDKTWMIEIPYVDLAIEILLEHYPNAEVPQRARASDSTEAWTGGQEDFQVLHLLPTAPSELVDAAYRTLAKLHHPDVGGDATVMRRLTEAHDVLSRRLSA